MEFAEDKRGPCVAKLDLPAYVSAKSQPTTNSSSNSKELNGSKDLDQTYEIPNAEGTKSQEISSGFLQEQTRQFSSNTTETNKNPEGISRPV